VRVGAVATVEITMEVTNFARFEDGYAASLRTAVTNFFWTYSKGPR
jgi:hypothetical protein